MCGESVDDSVLECRIVPIHGRESPHFVLAPNGEMVLSSGLADRLRDRCLPSRLMAPLSVGLLWSIQDGSLDVAVLLERNLVTCA